MKPKIIVLCGSSKFCDIMAVTAWLLEKKESAIRWYTHDDIGREIDKILEKALERHKAQKGESN